jgi:hypothetical protein
LSTVVNQVRCTPRTTFVATESIKGERDTDLTTAGHQLLAILIDLHTPEPRERIKPAHRLRHEPGGVGAFLAHASARRDSAPSPGPDAAG